jgi:hypothetical protein
MHRNLCKNIQAVKGGLERRQQKTFSVDELRGTVQELAPKAKSKLIKLVGEKCLIDVTLDSVSHKVLWDTGAQVCLVGQSWLQEHFPHKPVNPVSELVDEHLIVKSASGDAVEFSGYVEFEACPPKGDNCIRVPFLVTKVGMENPIIRYNVITLWLADNTLHPFGGFHQYTM